MSDSIMGVPVYEVAPDLVRGWLCWRGAKGTGSPLREGLYLDSLAKGKYLLVVAHSWFGKSPWIVAYASGCKRDIRYHINELLPDGGCEGLGTFIKECITLEVWHLVEPKAHECCDCDPFEVIHDAPLSDDSYFCVDSDGGEPLYVMLRVSLVYNGAHLWVGPFVDRQRYYATRKYIRSMHYYVVPDLLTRELVCKVKSRNSPSMPIDSALSDAIDKSDFFDAPVPVFSFPTRNGVLFNREGVR